MKTYFTFLGVWLLLSCTPQSKTENRLVALPFAVTGSAEAIPSFQKGLLLLHNFEYDDAAEAFLEAQKIDSSFVMAYWGEAMTYNHPVWGDLDLEKARATLQKLGESPKARVEKAKSALEADFLNAIEVLYGDGSKPDRDKQYSDYMETVFERYPGNHEAAAFYALSLLGIKTGWSKWEEANEKGAEISEAILKENPTHPGALHYLIHSDDHPEHAKHALAAANDYATVASYAGHALHMPSHIYLALGMWDDVVSSNEISWQAGVDRKERKGLTNEDLNYHAHIWLEYGYLQQGRYENARRLVENQVKFTTDLPSESGRFTLQQMKGYYLFETDEWTGEIADINIETKDLTLSIRSVGYLIDGAKAFHEKDELALNKVIQALETDLARATLLKNDNENISICGVKALVDKIPSVGELKRTEFISLELKGMLAWMNNDMNEAEKLFREAVSKGDGYLYGPPNILKPSQELFAEFLLAQNRPKEAFDQFELILKLAPNRLRSLKGELEAARQTNNAQKVAELEKKLAEILK
jgi:hypothetical protein